MFKKRMLLMFSVLCLIPLSGTEAQAAALVMVNDLNGQQK